MEAEDGAAWPDGSGEKNFNSNDTASFDSTPSVAFEGVKSAKKARVPRRIIHFSNGVVEEYSTDEEEVDNSISASSKMAIVDPKTLTWMPYLWYYTKECAWKTLAAADFCGEKLAWVFGITSPKYQYEIDEYRRMQKEEEEEEQREERERQAMEARRAAGRGDHQSEC